MLTVPTTSLGLDFRRQCEESMENAPIIVCVVPVVTIALSLNDLRDDFSYTTSMTEID